MVKHIWRKIKQKFCKHEYVDDKKEIRTGFFPYSYTILHYKRCVKCGKEKLYD